MSLARGNGFSELTRGRGSLAANRMPVEHVRTEIIAKNGTKDPFLYNPRSKAAEAGKVR